MQGDDAAGEVAPLGALPAGVGDQVGEALLVGPGPDRLGEVDVGVRRGRDRAGDRRAAPSSGTRGRRCGTARHVGWLNSQTTSRPPGRVTRSISRSPATGSTMLRSPKEIVTASKVSSANGSRVPSPAVNGRCRAGLLADLQHAEREVARHHGRAAVRERLARRPGAGGEVEHPLARPRVDGGDHVVAPAAVLAQGEHVVGDVVAPGDRVEHAPDVGRLLVEVCAGHAQRLRAAPRGAAPIGNESVTTARDTQPNATIGRHHVDTGHSWPPPTGFGRT